MKKAKFIAKTGMLTILAGIPAWQALGDLAGDAMIVAGAILVGIASVMILNIERKKNQDEINKLTN